MIVKTFIDRANESIPALDYASISAEEISGGEFIEGDVVECYGVYNIIDNRPTSYYYAIPIGDGKCHN